MEKMHFVKQGERDGIIKKKKTKSVIYKWRCRRMMIDSLRNKAGGNHKKNISVHGLVSRLVNRPKYLLIAELKQIDRT